MARNDDPERIEAVITVKETFASTGVLGEAFLFTGPVAYYPYGIVEVSMQRANGSWNELKATEYSLTAGGVGFQLNASIRVTAGTKIRIFYHSLGSVTTVAGIVDVQQTIPTAPVSGSFLTPDAVANAIGAGIVLNGVIVLADQDNDDDVFVGPAAVTAANGYRLGAGESCPVPASDLSEIYVIAVVPGDKVHYIGG